MMRVPPAHPQNSGDNPESMFGWNTPTKPKVIIDTSTNPIISNIFVMFSILFSGIKKIYGFVK